VTLRVRISFSLSKPVLTAAFDKTGELEGGSFALFLSLSAAFITPGTNRHVVLSSQQKLTTTSRVTNLGTPRVLRVLGGRLVCAADIVVLSVGKYASWVYASCAVFCSELDHPVFVGDRGSSRSAFSCRVLLDTRETILSLSRWSPIFHISSMFA